MSFGAGGAVANLVTAALGIGCVVRRCFLFMLLRKLFLKISWIRLTNDLSSAV